MKDSQLISRRWLAACLLAAAMPGRLPAAPGGPAAAFNPADGRKIAVKAVGDCAEDRVDACRQGLRRALELLPLHPEFLQYLASAEERAGNSAAALELLAAIHRQGYELTLDPPDQWIDRAAARPEYKKIHAETAALRAPLVRSAEAFRLPDREMIPESVAYDEKKGDFFVSSVRERRIVRRTAKGEVSDFVPAGRDGLWAVLGLAADPVRRHLWATSTAYPAMQGYEPSLEGRSALYCFDLDSGRLLGRYESARPGLKGFNDVRVAKDGAVFVSDHEERPGTLYRLDPETRKLEVFGDPDALGKPEGLAFSADGRHLFVADYSYGIVRYDLATARHVYLQNPPDASLVGIDHLDFYHGALIAVQNGNQPNSVMRLPLEGDRILRVETLERAHPAYSEATLGVLVGDDLYYVATSNWNRLDDDGKLPTAAELAAEPLAEPLVLRLPLGR